MFNPLDTYVAQPSRQSDGNCHSVLAYTNHACETDLHHETDVRFGGGEFNWATPSHELAELIEESPGSGSLALQKL